MNNIAPQDYPAFFASAFEDMEIPDDIRRASERICFAYGIGGLADPAYIANVIAKELGRGDGMSHFTKGALTDA